jgi:hypothetical protein
MEKMNKIARNLKIGDVFYDKSGEMAMVIGDDPSKHVRYTFLEGEYMGMICEFNSLDDAFEIKEDFNVHNQ